MKCLYRSHPSLNKSNPVILLGSLANLVNHVPKEKQGIEKAVFTYSLSLTPASKKANLRLCFVH